jgi:hydrogenase maturation factor HypF (carbamoyltransferase family)
MQRRKIEISGIVQGVGFRPHVHRLARHWGLVGFVQNCRGAVRIEVEGESDVLAGFCDELLRSPPGRHVSHLSPARFNRASAKKSLQSEQANRTQGKQASRPIWLFVPRASRNCSIQAIADIAIRLSAARNVVRG